MVWTAKSTERDSQQDRTDPQDRVGLQVTGLRQIAKELPDLSSYCFDWRFHVEWCFRQYCFQRHQTSHFVSPG
ncbi:hypothetical protein AVEN_146537-1, partial [Araneus ventricosus]